MSIRVGGQQARPRDLAAMRTLTHPIGVSDARRSPRTFFATGSTCHRAKYRGLSNAPLSAAWHPERHRPADTACPSAPAAKN